MTSCIGRGLHGAAGPVRHPGQHDGDGAPGEDQHHGDDLSVLRQKYPDFPPGPAGGGVSGGQSGERHGHCGLRLERH